MDDEELLLTASFSMSDAAASNIDWALRLRRREDRPGRDRAAAGCGGLLLLLIMVAVYFLCDVLFRRRRH